MASGSELPIEVLAIIGVFGLLIIIVQNMLRMPDPRVVVVQVEPPERRRGGCISLVIVGMIVLIALALLGK